MCNLILLVNLQNNLTTFGLKRKMIIKKLVSFLKKIRIRFNLRTFLNLLKIIKSKYIYFCDAIKYFRIKIIIFSIVFIILKKILKV